MPARAANRAVLPQPRIIRDRLRLVDATDEGSETLNNEFQDLVEVVLSIYVHPWYSYITPRNKSFIPHVNTVIFSLARSVVSRCDAEDVSQLLLIRLPTILAHHVDLFHLARAQAATSLVQQPHDTADSPMMAAATAYHNLANHLGIVASTDADRPAYVASPDYLGILTRQLLKTHLPAEDAKSELEMSLIQDIVARAVLENVLSKLAEPWFIWTIALAMLEGPTITANGGSHRSDRTLGTTISAFIGWIWSLVNTIWTIAFSMTRASESSSPPDKCERLAHVMDPWMLLGVALLRPADKSAIATSTWSGIQTAASLATPAADNAVPAYIRKHVLQPKVYAVCLAKLRATVFPNGQMAPSVIPPSPAETVLLRKRLERVVLTRIPAPARWLLFGRTEAEQRRNMADILEPFSNPAINAHLAVILLDAIAGLVLKPIL